MKIFTIFWLMFVLISCDPDHLVILSNQSNNTINVKVIGQNEYRFNHKDSITIMTSPKKTRKPIQKNKIEHSYMFNLEKGKDALLQGGIRVDLSQIVIINNKDSFYLKDDKRILIKRSLGSTSYIITIRYLSSDFKNYRNIHCLIFYQCQLKKYESIIL